MIERLDNGDEAKSRAAKLGHYRILAPSHLAVQLCHAVTMTKDDKDKAKKLKEKADDISRMARILKRRSDEQSAKKKPTRPREDFG